MLKKSFILIIHVTLLHFSFAQEKKEKIDYVNPMIGAFAPAGSTLSGRECGRTFPGPTTPFGLVQLSPDTFTGGDNGNGYSWFNKTIEGFSFTHLSGVGWHGDFGNFLVMPTTGPLKTSKGKEGDSEKGYRSSFSHENEVVKAGYYSVFLDDYQIKTELSAAPRAGMLRFTFPKNSSSRIQIDLARRIAGTSTEQYIKVVNDSTISGWMKCVPEGGGFGNGGGRTNYMVYFWCQFSKPLKKFGTWSASIPPEWKRKNDEVASDAYQQLIASAKVTHGITEDKGKHLGFFTEFKTKKGEEVQMKSGISFVSMEGAKENLEHDIPHWDFDKVVNDNRSLWSDALSKVNVTGGTEDDKTIFYTAMYHTMVDPRNFSDVNGNYIGADKQIHVAKDFTYRTVFSGWDVFRSQFPLQTLINPTLVNDEINSLIQMAELSGRKSFPRWEMVNAYSDVMIGNPAVSVIVDAYEKGIRKFDSKKAFEFSKNTVDNNGNGELGYVPGGISTTLEHCYSDWCLGRFAESQGKKDIAAEYYLKSKSYTNIWNDDVKWFRSRNKDKTWGAWVNKEKHGQGAVESNPYQQGWFVPHDIPGLIALMGKETFNTELVNFFEKSPDNFRWNDFYNHPNEPVHQVPFMFNEAGMPWLTQKWTRKISKNAYGSGVMGLCGNDDVGQLSAWYVLSAMGIHPICPGDNKYQITSPVFNKIEISLDKEYYNGNKFTIIANNNSSENIYIQSMQLNGKPLNRFWISHQEIIAGGTLALEMGPHPFK